MAKVWRAVQHGAAGFTRVVAIKEIKPEYNALRHYIDMFIEEARVGSDLQHPNIVQVHDFVIDSGSHYLVMEWVEGLDLGSLLQAFINAGRPMPWPLVVTAGISALRGLAAAHERRHADGSPAPIVHRDVSPHNILLNTAGVTKLTDFGLARARDRIISLTAPGMVKGKLSYLSPEVAYGDEATTLSDQFSMGNVLWEAFTGRRLFDAATDLELFRKIRGCQVEPLLDYRPDIPPELATVIHRALAAEPKERFDSARAMLNALISIMRLASWEGDAQADLGALVLRARGGRDLHIETERPAPPA